MQASRSLLATISDRLQYRLVAATLTGIERSTELAVRPYGRMALCPYGDMPAWRYARMAVWRYGLMRYLCNYWSGELLTI